MRQTQNHLVGLCVKEEEEEDGWVVQDSPF
jgi:hypothetical protein